MNASDYPVAAALYRHEFRKLIRWAPLGLLLVGTLCWLVMPVDVYQAHQIGASLALFVGIGALVIAMALALLQSFPELRQDARGFLLHRPASPRSIYIAKLLASFTVFSVSVVPPLLCVGVHLEWLGMERMPADWVQVLAERDQRISRLLCDLSRDDMDRSSRREMDRDKVASDVCWSGGCFLRMWLSLYSSIDGHVGSLRAVPAAELCHRDAGLVAHLLSPSISASRIIARIDVFYPRDRIGDRCHIFRFGCLGRDLFVLSTTTPIHGLPHVST